MHYADRRAFVLAGAKRVHATRPRAMQHDAQPLEMRCDARCHSFDLGVGHGQNDGVGPGNRARRDLASHPPNLDVTVRSERREESVPDATSAHDENLHESLA